MALPGLGTLLKIGDGATPTETFTTVAEVTEIGGPEFTLETDDSTPLDAAGGWEEVIPTILRHGDIPVTVNFDPQAVTHGYSSGMLKDMVTKTPRNFQLVFPDTGNTTWQLRCYVRRFRFNGITADRKLSASFDLRPIGQPTLA